MFARISTKRLAKAIRSSIRPGRLYPIAHRPFSNLIDTNNLLEAFGKEFEFERDNYEAVAEKADFLRTKGFEFHETNDGTNMILSKQFEDKTMEICFKSRLPGFESEGYDLSDEEDDLNEASYTDFTVYISKDNKGIIYECTCLNTEVSITQVLFSNDIKSFKNIPTYHKEEEVYLGPDFVSLPESIQKHMSNFLINSGIDQETVAFVEVMSLDKEQRLYMKWLTDLERFVKSPKII
ncbi:unnamed protein product [Moneuplotes crassus]|uniref:Mitochondrial acidic protein MAM33 n=1 Tax=Euplotes crassus TaxID=5936 RepID=A0AAD1XQ86_EUPCR|nr:unnamed protein product [Moneuplotes crassus]